MLLRNLIAVALVVWVLAGCGFRPMYGDSGSESVTTELSEIKIGLIGDRSGQELRNYLLDRLTPRGQPQKPAYNLGVQLDEELGSLAVERTGFPTRANLLLTADFVLRDATDNTVVVAGQARAISSYNLLDADFSNLASQTNARSRAAESIANQIQTRLSTHFAVRPQPTTTSVGG